MTPIIDKALELNPKETIITCINPDLDIENDMINEAEDTLTILSKYVNSLNIDNKKELDNLLISLYNESLTIETL